MLIKIKSPVKVSEKISEIISNNIDLLEGQWPDNLYKLKAICWERSNKEINSMRIENLKNIQTVIDEAIDNNEENYELDLTQYQIDDFLTGLNSGIRNLLGDWDSLFWYCGYNYPSYLIDPVDETKLNESLLSVYNYYREFCWENGNSIARYHRHLSESVIRIEPIEEILYSGSAEDLRDTLKAFKVKVDLQDFGNGLVPFVYTDFNTSVLVEHGDIIKIKKNGFAIIDRCPKF